MTTICKVNTTLRAIIKNNKKYMEQIKVAKISLKVNTKKSTIEKKEIYNYFKELNNDLVVASNKLVSYYWMRYLQADALPIEEKEKLGLINQKTNLPFTGKPLFKKYNKETKLQPYQVTINFFNRPGLSFIATSLSNCIENKFSNDINDVVKGKKSLPNFKIGMPIPINFNVNSPKLKKDYMFSFTKDIWFDLHFGKDRSNVKSIVDKIYAGTYKLCDSSIQFKDNEFFFLMVYKFNTEDNIELDKNVCVGVDLGIVNSAVVTLNEGYPREYITMQGQIDSLRNNVQKRKRLLGRELKNITGGRGRKHKLKALYDIRNYESNYVKNVNHIISKSIVNFSVKNKAGIIKMEDLSGMGDKNKKNKFLKDWSYFQLQTMVEYKAKEKGIEVVYINPKYTSQTCSKCGNLEEDQRVTQSEFICNYCGHKENADLNAARNIAKSNEVIK